MAVRGYNRMHYLANDMKREQQARRGQGTHRDTLRQDIQMGPPHSEETKRKAAITVAAHSHSKEECAEFLRALGLMK